VVAQGHRQRGAAKDEHAHAQLRAGGPGHQATS
jgi:hypothetical protein